MANEEENRSRQRNHSSQPTSHRVCSPRFPISDIGLTALKCDAAGDDEGEELLRPIHIGPAHIYHKLVSVWRVGNNDPLGVVCGILGVHAVGVVNLPRIFIDDCKV